MKDLVQTKTFWLGVFLIIFGVFDYFYKNGEHTKEFIFWGLSLICVRDAIRKLNHDILNQS